MTAYANLGEQLAAEIRATRESLAASDGRRDRALDALAAEQAAIKSRVDDLCCVVMQPGSSAGGFGSDPAGGARTAAIESCRHRREHITEKYEGAWQPSHDEIQAAQDYSAAFPDLLRRGRADAVQLHKASLSAFTFASNDFLVPSEMSGRILRCVVDQTDLAGIVGNQTTSAATLRFLVDNTGGVPCRWECEGQCVPRGQPIETLFGTVEIKPEPLNAVVCVSRTLLEDAGFDLEGWIVRRAYQGYRDAISAAILAGTGVGKPLGILNPQSGIPVCESSASTPPGQVSWQDLMALKFELPPQWQANARYLMNQRTLAAIAGMTDATGRPVMIASPIMGQALPQFTLFGSPITIVSQMPDPAPGALAVAYGDWAETYLLVTRRAMTMFPDPYTAGAGCVLYTFGARVSGAILCPNAARLLRVR